MKRGVLGAAILAAALAAGTLTACSDSGKETTADTTAAPTTAEDTTVTDAKTETTAAETEAAKTTATREMEKIIVGASPTPHAEISNAARKVLTSEDYELDIMEYTGYALPNNVLNSEDLDANYFQHEPYLDFFNEQNGTKLASTGTIHYEPFGIYTGETSSLDELKDKTTAPVPNDVNNEAKALLLLKARGLIKLKEDVGLEVTRNDVVENLKNLDIVGLEATQFPHSLLDCDIVVINGNYAIEAGLKVSDALATEDSESLAVTTYGNIMAIRKGDETTDATKALVEVLTSPEVEQFMEEKYGGTIAPLF